MLSKQMKIYNEYIQIKSTYIDKKNNLEESKIKLKIQIKIKANKITEKRCLATAIYAPLLPLNFVSL